MHFFLSHLGYPKENALPVYYIAFEFVGTDFRCQGTNLDEPLSAKDSSAYLVQA